MNARRTRPESAEHGRSLFMWTLCCIVAGSVLLAYAFTSLAAGRGEFVLPLDDTYIHFQYAKQLALGQPYVYNPGQPATSGATSFLYPYLLAVGYLIGFQGLNLGAWAMGLGAVALTGSMWLVYRLARLFDVPFLLAMLMAMIFALTGAVSWHYMSGMETGFVILFALLTLYGVVGRRIRVGVIGAALLALIRPEGGILALLAVGAMLLQTWRRGVGARYIVPLLIPTLAIGVQPLVNLIFTGSIVATGNQAKSILSMIPPDTDAIIGRILENFTRMWAEFATGESPREGVYILFGVVFLAAFGLWSLLIRRDRRLIGLMILGWLLAGTAAISTLDPAFWHFKRYQMPLIALFFPLAAWGAAWLLKRLDTRGVSPRMGSIGFFVIGVVVLFMPLINTSATFLRYYAMNVIYVWAQPLAMARWLDANTPPDATVAVHDVGMMRYVGGRTTIDMVGLTTPGAADYWRNGPGSVAEFLENQRPDYIAAYDDARGLSYLADTDIYGELLAGFPVSIDNSLNVALAGEFQGIYQPDWEYLRYTDLHHTENVYIPMETGSLYFRRDADDIVNVAELASEVSHHYTWRNNERLPGFPTEVYQQWGFCGDCTFLDAGRLINGEERFTVTTTPDKDIMLITRIQPMYRGTLDVYANGTYVDTRWIPEIPGRWLTLATWIPSDLVRDAHIDIRIVPNVPGGYYMPYTHWAFTTDFQIESPEQEPLATFQDGTLALVDAQIEYMPPFSGNNGPGHYIGVPLEWYSNGGAQGDYVVFLHLYNDIDAPPIAQDDQRIMWTLSPGNLLPGIVHDTMGIWIHDDDIEPGTYQVAIGMYDPVTGERLQPTGGDEHGRLFIGEIEIE